VILLPAALINQLTLEETEAIIIHELVHIRNNDYLINLFLMVTESVCFFNPAIHRMIDEVKLEREKECDLSVLDFHYAPVKYAESLLAIARHAKQHNTTALPATGEGSQLLQRVRFILQPHEYPHPVRRKKPMYLLLIAGLMILGMMPLREIVPSPVTKGPSLAEKVIVMPKSMKSVPTTNVPSVPSISIAAKPQRQKKAAAKATPEKAEKETMAVETPANEPLIPEASFVAYDPSAPEKTVILEEETGGGKKVMKAFAVRFRNNRWEIEPLWTLTVEPGQDDTAQ
jgi:hypothetical protein